MAAPTPAGTSARASGGSWVRAPEVGSWSNHASRAHRQRQQQCCAAGPVLTTEAAPSYEDQFAARKRRYLTMMLLRMACLLTAVVVHGTWWPALGFVLLSIPLP